MKKNKVYSHDEYSKQIKSVLAIIEKLNNQEIQELKANGKHISFEYSSHLKHIGNMSTKIDIHGKTFVIAKYVVDSQLEPEFILYDDKISIYDTSYGMEVLRIIEENIKSSVEFYFNNQCQRIINYVGKFKHQFDDKFKYFTDYKNSVSDSKVQFVDHRVTSEFEFATLVITTTNNRYFIQVEKTITGGVKQYNMIVKQNNGQAKLKPICSFGDILQFIYENPKHRPMAQYINAINMYMNPYRGAMSYEVIQDGNMITLNIDKYSMVVPDISELSIADVMDDVKTFVCRAELSVAAKCVFEGLKAKKFNSVLQLEIDEYSHIELADNNDYIHLKIRIKFGHQLYYYSEILLEQKDASEILYFNYGTQNAVTRIMRNIIAGHFDNELKGKTYSEQYDGNSNVMLEVARLSNELKYTTFAHLTIATNYNSVACFVDGDYVHSLGIDYSATARQAYNIIKQALLSSHKAKELYIQDNDNSSK